MLARSSPSSHSFLECVYNYRLKMSRRYSCTLLTIRARAPPTGGAAARRVTATDDVRRYAACYGAPPDLRGHAFAALKTARSLLCARDCCIDNLWVGQVDTARTSIAEKVYNKNWAKLSALRTNIQACG